MANEKRLVDAEAIARKLKNAHCAECHVVRKVQCSACWVEDILELLDDEAVDAVEVVHGEWVVCGDGEYVPFLCSACGKTTSWYHAQTANYCPNCGAKMDGDGNAQQRSYSVCG